MVDDFIWIDLSKFDLIKPFNNKSDYEYAWIPEWVIPEYIMEEYNLKPLIQKVFSLAECRTCIYGLPQPVRFYNINPVKNLSGDLYFPTFHTTGSFCPSHNQQQSILLSKTLVPKILKETM